MLKKKKKHKCEPLLTLAAHVPGRAGGGWECDELRKSSPPNSGSTVSVDSIEK
jgi:hypothetical protein